MAASCAKEPRQRAAASGCTVQKEGSTVAKKISTLCVSSLHRGHANLLCVVPNLTDDPRRESETLVLPPRYRCAAPAARFCTAHVGEPLACAPLFF